MSMKMTREQAATLATLHPEADSAAVSVVVDRTFHLPPALYFGTVGSYFGFLGLMTIAFGNANLVIPMVIFAFSIIAGFSIPYIWSTMNPDSGQRTIDWGRFLGEGVQTLTGKLTASEAAVQVLTLPVLIFLWGVAALIIGSSVRG